MQCSCKPGYTGTQCESCAPGYFGNPQKFGGSCQPCRCNSNGHLGSCDPVTGDCINQEPKDDSPGEECDDCDSCVMTLLNDLATMDEELRVVKSQLQGLSVSADRLQQMRHLETQTKDLRVRSLGSSVMLGHIRYVLNRCCVNEYSSSRKGEVDSIRGSGDFPPSSDLNENWILFN